MFLKKPLQQGEAAEKHLSSQEAGERRCKENIVGEKADKKFLASKDARGVRVKERRLSHCPDKPESRWHSSSPAAASAPSAGSWHPGTDACHPPGPLQVSIPLLPSEFHYLNLGKETKD